jgi:hypothetical protein
LFGTHLKCVFLAGILEKSRLHAHYTFVGVEGMAIASYGEISIFPAGMQPDRATVSCANDHVH